MALITSDCAPSSWVTLRQSDMNWYKQQGQKSETGSLTLTGATR